MKHSIFVKFIAIVLCAASLLALAGSGLGIWLMVELDLYDKTVDQYREETYQEDTRYFAQMMAHRYAGRELGGLPEDYLENHYPTWYDRRFEEGGFGYAILDSDGNVLEAENEEIKTYGHAIYSFPIEGNYMHLVSAEPVKKPTPATEPALDSGDVTIIDNLTQDGVDVHGIHVVHSDGSSQHVYDRSPIGYLSRQDDGSVFYSANPGNPFGVNGTFHVSEIQFENDYYGQVYGIYGNEGQAVAIIQPQVNSGGTDFTTITFTIGPTAIEPVATPVYKAIFYGLDSETPIEILGSDTPIGAAFLDENGQVQFELQVESTNLQNAAVVASMVLMDQDGTVLFGQTYPRLLTSSKVTTDAGLVFTSSPDAVAMGAPESASLEEAAPTEAPVEAAMQAADQDTVAVETMPQETSIPTITVETIPATVPATVPPTMAPTLPAHTIPVAEEETVAETAPATINGKRLDEYDTENLTYYDNETQQEMKAKVVYLPIPDYTVEVFFLPDRDQNAQVYFLLELLRQFSQYLIPVLLGSLAVMTIATVYLCAAAGHRKDGTIRAGGLNRLPLDLYACLAGAAIVCLGALFMVTFSDLFPRNMMVAMVLAPLSAYAICLVFVGFCFGLVAQCKTPGGYWWRNSLCGRVLTGGVGSLEKGTDWTVKKFFPWLWKVICKFWDICLFLLGKCWKCIVYLWSKLGIVWGKLAICIKTSGRWLFKLIRRAIDMLPLTWQWMLGGALLLLLGLLVWANRRDGWGILWLLVGFAMILYLSQCFGILLGAAKRMNKGDLETKLNDKRMVGCFREFAEDLNNLADVVVVAAQKEMRSERMKTELITNVSHDIKTPLTSIINYVDLLQKPHTEEEGKQYLEVLDRQSQRLKKLIDDLMDMSKANTGNMHVDIIRMDAVEAVNQALGEFSDKLDKADLTPVFRHNTPEAFVMADGRLVWRVLSNLLGNAVKYAMPGTRLYLDLMKLDGRVILSLKNISRDELNVDAEELMERFVRGDDSRNTEGSGLGLNIAKSLMELQKGHLQLLVDGDLFKVTLVFPTAE